LFAEEIYAELFCGFHPNTLRVSLRASNLKG